MNDYLFNYPLLKSSSKVIEITPKQGDEEIALKRTYPNLFVKSLVFILSDFIPFFTRLQPLWCHLLLDMFQVNLKITYNNETLHIRQSGDRTWDIIQNEKEVGFVLGKSSFSIDKEGAKEIVIDERVFIIASSELGPDVEVFSENEKHVGTFKSDLYHLEDGVHSLRLLDPTASTYVPIIIGCFYLNNYLQC